MLESQMKSAATAFEQGNFSAAADVCAEVLLRQANHREALDLRGRACRSLKDHAGALRCWLALEDNASPQLWKRIRIIYTLLALKKHEEARIIALAAQAQWPNDPQLLCQMTTVYQALCEWSEITRIWTAVNALEPGVLRDLVQDPLYLMTCGRVAWAYVHLQQYSEATEICEQMLDMATDSQQALNIQLAIYRQRREWDKALHLAQLLTKNNPNELRHLRQTVTLLGTLGRSEEAMEMFRQAKSTFAHDAMACAQLALIAELKMWSHQAQELLQTALDLAPANTELLTCLIEGYWELDQVDTPLYLMKKLKALCPETFSANATVKNVLTLLKIAGVEEKLLPGAGRLGQKTYRTALVAKAIVDRVKKSEPVKTKAIYKIAMISASMKRGGAERQVATCLKSLTTDSEHHFDVSLYSSSHEADIPDTTYYREILGLPIKLKEFHTQAHWDIMDHADADVLEPWSEILRLLPWGNTQKVAQLVYLFHEQKPDIVHAWQDDMNIPACLAALIAGAPRILLFARTLAPQTGKNELKLKPYNLRARTWRAAYRYLLQNPDTSLCHNSNVGAQSYKAWLGDPLLKMPVIHNGVDFDGITNVSERGHKGESCDKTELLRGALVMGTVFRIEPVKQPLLWIEVAQIVHATFPQCKFLIVGGGSMLETCKQRVNELGMSHAFVFTGPSTTVKAWLDLMNIFLMTSHIEGLPNALIEAQGFGVPAVSTDAGGSSEVIIDGVTGRIAADDANSIAATIISCLEDPAWLRAASSAAISHARQTFSVASMHVELKKLYRL